MRTYRRKPAARIVARARELRRPLTPPEAMLWDKLRDRRLNGYKFRRQHPIGSYVADFCCTTSMLIVELDGDSHSEQVHYDAARTAWLQSEGFCVIRFINRDIVNNLEGVVAAILLACEDGTTSPEH